MSLISTLAVLLQVDPGTLTDGTATQALFDAVVNKNWWLVAGLAVWLAVTLARKYAGTLPFLGKFFSLKWSGPATALLFSAAGALLTALFSGQAVTFKLLISILGAAAVAVFTQEFGQKAKEAAAGKASDVKSAADADKVLKEVK